MKFKRSEDIKKTMEIGLHVLIKDKIKELDGEILHLNLFAEGTVLKDFEHGLNIHLISGIKDKTKVNFYGRDKKIRVVIDNDNFIIIADPIYFLDCDSGKLSLLWKNIKDLKLIPGTPMMGGSGSMSKMPLSYPDISSMYPIVV